MTITWPANSLRSIHDLYYSLDYQFVKRLESTGCSLFRLLELPFSQTGELGPLVDILLSHYDSTQDVFIFGSHRLRITLEDVLFITGLPISGNPVICSNNSRGADAFQRLFGPDANGKYLASMELIRSYATNKGDNDKRMIAVLLFVISSFITPISDFETTYVEFVENLVEVDSYAWGAALLAFLYSGIKKWKYDQTRGKTNLSIHGNVWLLLCFFFIRIPKLTSAVGVKLDLIVEKVGISRKYHCNYKKDVVNILNNLSDEDIRWLPYDSSWLPPRLQDQYRFRALVAPLFCNNYVVHHRPQLVPKQFGLSLTEGSVAGFERYEYEIKIKHDNLDFLTLYKKEIELWEEGKQLQDFIISSKRSADNIAEASSHSHPQKKSKKITELGKEESDEQKIRLLQSEKLKSELRVALERNVKLQGEIKNLEACEKKLKSELNVAVERNEILQSEIDSSEAREKKLVSENVKLKGEIKSLEAREEKLKSEVRAAVERNAKLEGEIKNATSSLAKLFNH